MKSVGMRRTPYASRPRRSLSEEEARFSEIAEQNFLLRKWAFLGAPASLPACCAEPDLAGKDAGAPRLFIPRFLSRCVNAFCKLREAVLV